MSSAPMNQSSSTSSSPRKIFQRLSIATGNIFQIGGLAAACIFLALARSTHSQVAAIAGMIAAWILLYFCCHAIAHWTVGRLLGIRFAFYTIGGTGNPAGYPPTLRWLFEHLPFFGVQTEKASMQRASSTAKAIMWSAGVTSSVLIPALGAFYAWSVHIPGSTLFLMFAVLWALGALSSNWRSSTGDFAKARRAFLPSFPDTAEYKMK
jgi:hypothetical protein